MATNNMNSDKLKELRGKLEGATNVMDEGHVKVIKDTSKELFDIFQAPDTVADFSIQNDIEETKKILEERQNALVSKETISTESLNDNYKELNKKSGEKIKDDDKGFMKKKAQTLYEDTLVPQVSKLPAFNEFGKKIREDIKYKIASKMELFGDIEEEDMDELHQAFDDAGIFKVATEPAMKEKLTRMILLFTQLELFQEKGEHKNQLEQAEKIISQIRKNNRQISAYNTTAQTMESIKKRQESFEGLEKTDPKNMGTIKYLNKDIPTNISISLDKQFLDTAKLSEVPEGYEISELKFYDAENKPVEIYEDDKGTAFTKKLTKGTAAEFFVKEGTTFKKIGKIGITDASPNELSIDLDAYKDLPTALAFPLKIDMKAQGIGGQGGALTDKVSISKKIDIKLDKPDFTEEYDNIEKTYDINNKLDNLFQEVYEAQLKDRFYEFMAQDEKTKKERGKLSNDEKEHFFQEVVMKNVAPAWMTPGLYVDEINKANCYGNTEFVGNAAKPGDFKKRILKIFTGKTEADIKKLMFEKLGNLDFTELNPTYAIKIIADKISEKYTTHKDGIYKMLNEYRLNIRGAGKKIKIPKEKLPSGELADVKEITAVVADSKEITAESAYEKAKKEVEEYYKSGVKFGFKRARVFFFREKMMKKLIAKELKNNKGLQMDDTTNSAVNRWMLEKAMGTEIGENIVENTSVFKDPAFQKEFDTIVNAYIKDDKDLNADENFKIAIQDLIEGNQELRNYMRDNNITHLGSNVIEQLKSEKAERRYYGKLIETIDKYAKDGVLNKPQEFEKAIREQLSGFIQEQKKLPDMLRSLKLDPDKIEFATKLANHRTQLEKMKGRSIKMRMNLLLNKSETEKGLTTAQHVNRDKFDVKHASKFTRWMEKHPRWTTGITVLGLVGTGILGAVTAPVVGVAGGASILRYLNFLKKKGHYTQEHKKFEETIIKMTPKERETYLAKLQETSEKKPKRLRWIFPSKHNKYAQSMEYMNNLDSIENIEKKIKVYTESGTMLNPTEKRNLKMYLVEATSLLAMHKEKGRNFMYGQQGNEKIEELYNGLHKMIIAGITRYSPTTKNPESMVSKLLATHNNKIQKLEGDYADSYKKMRNMRTKLGIMAGTKSAAIYVGSAYALGRIKNQIVDGRDSIFGSENTATGSQISAAPHTPGTTVTVLDPAFGVDAMGKPDGHLLLSKIFDGDVTKYNAFVSKMQSLPAGDHSATLRGTMKNIYGSDALANAKTQEFFNQFTANITDSTGNELVKLGTLGNLSSVDAISSKMISWGYNGMVTDPSQIQGLLDGLRSGTYTLNTLPAGWTKETACNVLFCNTYGSELKSLMFDTVVNTPPPLSPLPPLPPIDATGGGVTNFLSAGVPTVWNEMNKFNEEEKK